MASAANIPLIDISASGEEAQLRVAKELVDAAVEHGFVYIRNTGADIPADAVDRAFDLGKKLFDAPLEEKQKCTIQKNNRGWGGMKYETLDPKNQKSGDLKEAFNFGAFEDGKAQQPIPESVASYESQYSDFYEFCYKLCLKINYLLGIGLEVQPPTFFRDRHLREGGPSGNILRFLYYPPPGSLDQDDGGEDDVRAGAHSDYGSITLLFRLAGQAGLEVSLRDGSWAPVPVVPPGAEGDPSPPILVNIGDLLSYWTNGLLRSTVHRVVFPGAGGGALLSGESCSEPRYSIAFFCHPVGTTTLEAVPSERVRAHEPTDGAEWAERGANPDVERKAITADEHLQMRLRASYLQMYDKEEKQ
ncbi:hypothetical protein J7T55_004650 [Diaporthe amygdali]|uniref:uncharacterized protein n=1 Tax=Phomopsis amygdali TaxID=1214568 RepID=UPI0022FDF6D6|nr:uncharacterized protein J7T55_004650 [Diaporthe amygdali]KAJ0114908.1 hypothetical protein J7T55_004650 [Diaporthe amygdali]